MTPNLDEKDMKILEILEENADYSTRKISEKTLIPITTVHNRIKKLEKAGVIKKYTVELDYSKLNRDFVAYILVSVNLPLLKQKKKTQYNLAEEIKKFPFVERVDIVSGGTDLVVIVRTKSVKEFDKILLCKLQTIEGIDNTQSLIVIHKT